MHRILSHALKQAVRWQLLANNPCDAVSPPRVERKQMAVMDVDGTIEMIEAARPTPLFIPIVLGVFCGLRRGEAAAICWRHVDLEAGRLSIVVSLEETAAGVRLKPPKSGRSRTVALPALAVEELRRHRLRQAEELLRLGVRQSEDTNVCLQKNYERWVPSNLTSAFYKFIRAQGSSASSPSRPETFTRNSFACRKCASQDRSGATWPRQYCNDDRPVQPCDAGHAGRRRCSRRCGLAGCDWKA